MKRGKANETQHTKSYVCYRRYAVYTQKFGNNTTLSYMNELGETAPIKNDMEIRRCQEES